MDITKKTTPVAGVTISACGGFWMSLKMRQEKRKETMRKIKELEEELDKLYDSANLLNPRESFGRLRITDICFDKFTITSTKRMKHALMENDIMTVKDLQEAYTSGKLKKMKGIGNKSLWTIQDFLSHYDLI